MWRRILSQEKKSLGGLNPRGIIVREENFGGKPTGRKKFGGKMGPSPLQYLPTSHCLGLDLNGLLTRRNF